LAANKRGRKPARGPRDRELVRIELVYAAERGGEQLGKATKEELAPHRFLDGLLEAEPRGSEERRMKTLLQLSGLLPGQIVGNFAFQPSIEHSRSEAIGTCA